MADAYSQFGDASITVNLGGDLLREIAVFFGVPTTVITSSADNDASTGDQR